MFRTLENRSFRVALIVRAYTTLLPRGFHAGAEDTVSDLARPETCERGHFSYASRMNFEAGCFRRKVLEPLRVFSAEGCGHVCDTFAVRNFGRPPGEGSQRKHYEQHGFHFAWAFL